MSCLRAETMSVQHEHFCAHLWQIIPVRKSTIWHSRSNPITVLHGSTTIQYHYIRCWLHCSVPAAFRQMVFCVVCVFSPVQMQVCIPNEASVMCVNSYVVFGKCGAHCITRCSFSLMNSGVSVACRDAYSFKNTGVSQQPRCPSSHPSGHSFKQPGPHPPIYTVIHLRVKPSMLSACQKPQNKQLPYAKVITGSQRWRRKNRKYGGQKWLHHVPPAWVWLRSFTITWCRNPSVIARVNTPSNSHSANGKDHLLITSNRFKTHGCSVN